MGTRGLAYKAIEQITTSTAAPVSGDWRLFYDASAGEWVKQDASTGDQLFDEVDIGTLSLGGTAVTASAAEINRTNDLSARVVALTGTTPITLAAHEGRDLYITGTAAATYTMPEPTGSGGRYRFIMGEVSSNPTIITFTDQVNTNFIGHMMMLDADGSVPVSAVNGDHNITLDGNGATGGALGDFIELTDVATDVWAVHGSIFVLAGQAAATPFNAA